jgi:hypothetical protein
VPDQPVQQAIRDDRKESNRQASHKTHPRIGFAQGDVNLLAEVPRAD